MWKVREAYYTDFATYLIETHNNETPLMPKYSYKSWLSDKESLSKLTIVELKSVLKIEKCRVSGTRLVLINRLTEKYKKIQSAIAIQSAFRGFVARESERLRGVGHKERHRCVNDTDFQTMDSLSEIPHECFFSYTDYQGFTYGFNVFSLMVMFKRNRRFVNPYNREDIPIATVSRIFSLYKKIEVLYPLVFKENRLDNERIIQHDIRRAIRDAELFEGMTIPDTFEIEDPPSHPLEHLAVEPETQTSESLIQRRTVALFERISELIHIRVEPDWFLSLSNNEYDRFYHFYHIWWSRPNSLSEIEKREICASADPFFNLSQIGAENETRHRIFCLELLEQMVYTGINESKCKLGSEQAITILSVVSKPARRACPELFDRLE